MYVFSCAVQSFLPKNSCCFRDTKILYVNMKKSLHWRQFWSIIANSACPEIRYSEQKRLFLIGHPSAERCCGLWPSARLNPIIPLYIVLSSFYRYKICISFSCRLYEKALTGAEICAGFSMRIQQFVCTKNNPSARKTDNKPFCAENPTGRFPPQKTSVRTVFNRQNYAGFSVQIRQIYQFCTKIIKTSSALCPSAIGKPV